MITEMDLRATVAAAQQGKPQALDHLYVAYADRIRRYCYARLSDIEAAHDCVQEVFLRVWKALPSLVYHDDVSFLAWLFTIANNIVVDIIRKQRKIALLPIDQVADVCSPRDLSRTVSDHLALQSAIHHLTADQQQVITLRFFAGLSIPEIALITNRPEGAVKAMQHRALRRLQILLSEDSPAQHANRMPQRRIGQAVPVM